MRLWSLSTTYLDDIGLSRCFNEGKIGLRALIKGSHAIIDSYIGKSQTGKSLWGKQSIKTPYYNHPQLNRFKATKKAKQYLSNYLWGIYKELKKRGMVKDDKFDTSILLPYKKLPKINVTKDQLEYEFRHLQKKLLKRNLKQYATNLYYACGADMRIKTIKVHLLFRIVKGEIEKWEKVK